MKFPVMQSNETLRCLDNGKVGATSVSECGAIYGVAPYPVFVRANRMSELINSSWSELVHLGHLKLSALP